MRPTRVWPGVGIDKVKSARGESTTDIDNLEIDRHYDKA
jgi:twitching motility protein PilT